MVSEEEHSYIEHRNWKRMGVVVQGNVYWLRVKIVNGVEQVAVAVRPSLSVCPSDCVCCVLLVGVLCMC